jgi:hypothetical protein
MGPILAIIFSGISFLATHMAIIPTPRRAGDSA